MKITLRRFIEVESYAVQMTIFEKEDERPEILPLLKAVKEANLAHTNVVTYFQNKILLDLPETFIRNVLEELRLMELIMDDGELSERGHETLESEIVMIPRTGPYLLDIVNDPLIPQIILRYTPLKIGLKHDLFKKEEEVENSIVELPSYLLETINRGIETYEDQPQTVIIKEISEKGTFIPNNRRVELELRYSDYWQQVIRYRNFRGTISLPNSFDGDQLIDSLFIQISKEADLDQWRIPQTPDLLNLTELSRFKKEFKIPSVLLDELGTFTQVKLEDIPIFPANEESAYQWAIKLFLEELSNYLFGSRYLDAWEDLFHTYPMLREYEFDYPTLEDLWAFVPFGSQKYWFLRAPYDMELEEGVE